MKTRTIAKNIILVLSVSAMLGAGSSYACSAISHQYNNSGEFSSRSMDFCTPLKTEMKVYPQGQNFNGVRAGTDLKVSKTISWQNKYGYAAILQPDFGDDITAEGINEKGLGLHLLMGNAQYPEQLSKQVPVLDSYEWMHYILGNYATVSSVVKDIKDGKYQLTTFPISVHGKEITLPIHFKVEDKSGNSAIIEFDNGKLNVKEGEQYTVLTNEPNYDAQLANLAKYKSQGTDYTIDNLPGGAKSSNRFVRASFISENLPMDVSSQNKNDGVNYMFSAINSVTVPFTEGYHCDFSPNAPIEDKWPTQWVSAMDLNQNKLYFINEHDGNRVWVELNELDLSKGRPPKKISLDNPNLSGDISQQFSA